MNARMTLIGIQKMLSIDDKSISDTWDLPESVELENTTYDSQVLLATIVMKGGRFEPLYTNPDYFYMMCGMWWQKWLRTFSKWFVAFDKEYEPLWDRDGHETVHEDTHEVLDNDTTYESKRTIKEVMDDDTTSNTTTENTVSAYDSSTYQPHDKTTINSSGTDDRTTDTTDDANGSGTSDSDNDKDFDREYHSWGNWGISMTAQKLLESELKVQGWNIYEHIADIFCNEMLVRVY